MSKGQNRQNYGPIYQYLVRYSQVGVAVTEQLKEIQ